MASWQNNDFGKRIDVTAPSPDANLTFHPLAIILDGLSIVDTDIVQDEWALYDHNDNLLNWEREAYAEAGGTCTGVIWCAVDQYSAPSGEQNHVFFYYNKVSGSVPGNTPASVWDANHMAVLHLQDTTPFADSSGEGNPAADTGTAQTAGKIDNCRDVNSAGDLLTMTDAVELDGMDNLTVESWVYADTYGHSTLYGRILAKGNGDPYMLSINDFDNADMVQFKVNGTTLDSANNSFSVGAWHHVVGVWTRNTVGGHVIYIDGVSQGSANAADSAVNASADDVIVGNRAAADRTFDGKIDEVRISNVARAAAWVKHNFTVIDTGLSYAAIESKPSGLSIPIAMHHYQQIGAH